MRSGRNNLLGYERRPPPVAFASNLSRREIAVILGIILILLAILVPVVQKVRTEAAKAAANQRPAPTTVIQHSPVYE